MTEFPAIEASGLSKSFGSVEAGQIQDRAVFKVVWIVLVPASTIPSS